MHPDCQCGKCSRCRQWEAFRRRHHCKVSDGCERCHESLRWERIFERNHGVVARAYYNEAPAVQVWARKAAL